MGYLCDTHPDTPGALLITNLDTGDTAVCCGYCVHPWAAAIAAATAPDTLDEPIALEATDPVTGDPTHDDAAGDEDPAPFPGPAPAASPEPEPEQGDDDGDEPIQQDRSRVLAAVARADELEQASADA